MRELLGGNGAVRDESAAALQIVIRGALCLFTLLDLRPQFLALREQPAHLAHGARQVGLRIGHGDLRIRRIELAAAAARRCDELGVIDVQREHRAGHFAGHLHHVAVDVGVVGGLVVPAVEEPVAAVAERRRARRRRPAPSRPDAPRAARRMSRLVIRGSLGFLRVHGLTRVKGQKNSRRCVHRRARRRRGDRSCRRPRGAASPARPPGSVRMSTMDWRAASTCVSALSTDR